MVVAAAAAVQVLLVEMLMRLLQEVVEMVYRLRSQEVPSLAQVAVAEGQAAKLPAMVAQVAVAMARVQLLQLREPLTQAVVAAAGVDH